MNFFIKGFSRSWKTWTISWWCCRGLDDGVGGTDVLLNPTMHLQTPASPACGEAVYELWVLLVWSSLVGSYFWPLSYSLTLNSPLRCSCYVYILTASAEKRPKHQPLHIKHNLCSLKILRICFLAVWISQKPLPEYIFSIWSTSLLVSHFLWTSSDPTSLEMSRSIQQKRSWKQCAKVVLLNPHTTPPPMQWLLVDGFVDS